MEAQLGESVRIEASDGGSFSAYFASPRARAAPGIVLIQYICGVNKVMRELADSLAERGYFVAVPDLFWRQEPEVRLIDEPSRPAAAEQRKALALNTGFDDDLGIADLCSTLAWLGGRPGCSGKIGALGYCLGGRLAYLMAARSEAFCCVGYYGVNIEKYLGEAIQIRRPLLLHIAGEDELSSAEARAQIIAAVSARPGALVETYPGAGHAFALPGGGNFDPAAAELANRRSLSFLAKHLALEAPS